MPYGRLDDKRVQKRRDMIPIAGADLPLELGPCWIEPMNAVAVDGWGLPVLASQGQLQSAEGDEKRLLMQFNIEAGRGCQLDEQ